MLYAMRRNGTSPLHLFELGELAGADCSGFAVARRL